jgi:hypothetical protein
MLLVKNRWKKNIYNNNKNSHKGRKSTCSPECWGLSQQQNCNWLGRPWLVFFLNTFFLIGKPDPRLGENWVSWASSFPVLLFYYFYFWPDPTRQEADASSVRPGWKEVVIYFFIFLEIIFILFYELTIHELKVAGKPGLLASWYCLLFILFFLLDSRAELDAV